MYATSVLIDNANKKKLGFRLFDESSMRTFSLPYDIVSENIKNGKISVKNIYLDSCNRIQLLNMNPNSEYYYYDSSYSNGNIIKYFCIIVSEYKGRLNFIADTANGIITGKNLSIGEIAGKLGVAKIEDLMLYNGIIKENSNNIDLYLYNGKNYYKVGEFRPEYIYDLFNDNWKVIFDSADNSGLRVKRIMHRNFIDDASIPEGVSHIEKFEGNVNKLTLPITVKSLGDECFSDLVDIHTLRIRGDIKVIPKGCFAYSSIKRVSFSGYEFKIEDYAFFKSKLSGSVISNTKYVGVLAFACSKLEKIYLNKVKEIKNRAFENCTKLEVADFSKSSLEVIHGFAFENCKKLKEVKLPKTVKYIGRAAFRGCKNLNEIVLPQGVELKKDTIPENCKVIVEG